MQQPNDDSIRSYTTILYDLSTQVTVLALYTHATAVHYKLNTGIDFAYRCRTKFVLGLRSNAGHAARTLGTAAVNTRRRSQAGAARHHSRGAEASGPRSPHRRSAAALQPSGIFSPSRTWAAICLIWRSSRKKLLASAAKTAKESSLSSS